MSREIVSRVLEEASYLLLSDATIREIAKVFGVSKSTVHKDLNDRLKEIDDEISGKVSKVLYRHAMFKHIKGGEATKNKYSKAIK